MTLLELLHLLKRHLFLVIALPIVCAIAAAGVCYTMMSNTYTATTSLYVLAAENTSDNSTNLNTTLNASQLVSNDIAALIKSDRVMNGAADDLGLENLNAFKVSVNSQTTTRVITLTVTGKDPQQAADVANAIASEVSTVAQQVMDVRSVNVVDEAATPSNPSGPNRPMYVAVAFLAGLFLAIAIVVLMDMLNTRVSNSYEVEKLLGIPVIGQFPAVKKG